MAQVKIYDRNAELIAVKTLCEGSQEIKDLLYGKLSDDHFFDENTKQIFSRLAYFNALGKRVNTLSLLLEDVALKDNQTLQVTIQECLHAESEGDVYIIIESLNHFRKLRFLLEELNKVNEKVKAENKELDKVVLDLDNITEKYSRIKDVEDDVVHIGYEDTGREVVDKILTFNPNEYFFKTGFNYFDNRTGGFGRGQLALLGANSSGGKSTMAAQLLVNMYSMFHKNVGLVSYEMGKEEVLGRILSNISSVEYNNIKRNNYADTMWQDPKTGKVLQLTGEQQKQMVSDAYDRFTRIGQEHRCRYIIDCTSSDTTIDEAANKLKIYGMDVFVFDYLNLLKGKDEIQGWESLDWIVKRGKILARRLNALVILLIQLKENLQIKYSKNILNHADYFWGWMRDDESKESQILKIHQLKARSDLNFDFELLERFKYMQILDLEAKQEEAEKRLTTKEG